jgi:hypothetical protein
MKFSLRSLMIGITLFCILLGGRIEYLRRWAVFHEGKAESNAGIYSEFATSPQADAARAKGSEHSGLAARYRRAMYRPWTVVDDTLRVKSESREHAP